LLKVTAIKKTIILLRITAIKKTITLLKVTAIKKITILLRFTANEKNTLLKVTAIKKIIPVKAESLKKEFGATCVYTRARYLKKYIRETRMPAVTRIRLKRLYEITYRKVRGHGCLRVLLFGGTNTPRAAEALREELGATYEMYGGTAAYKSRLSPL